MSGSTLAVIILTHNEAPHIARCLASAQRFADACYVVDSGSSDGTRDIAASMGATVLQHPFVNYSTQFQWALDTIGTDATWLMRLDADEVVDPDLAQRLRNDLHGLPADVVGVNLDLKYIFMGRWIRHGGRYPLRLLRVFRRGHGRIEQRWMDEHIIVSGGRTVVFEGGFADHNLKDLTFFIDKHNRYATREALDALNLRHQLFARDVNLAPQAVSRQAALRRFVKERIYNRLPFPLSSTCYFLFRYIVQLGVLDGIEGLVYHVLQAFWYRFLVGAKLMELERGIAGLEEKAEIIARLEQLTGHRLT
jgi:glycosyltransferase involved in cell wall biosynthesis